MIELEIYTDDPDDRVLIERYWATNEDGTFKENVSNLLPFREIKNSRQLTSYICQLSQAWDQNQICSYCDGFHKIFARSEVKRTPQKPQMRCSDCRELEEENQKAEKLRLYERLRKRTEENLAASCDYGEISDDDALILLALHRALNPRLLSHTFMYRDCASLVPTDSNFFVDKLRNSEILFSDYLAAKEGTYSLKDDEIWCVPGQQCFFLVPDSTLGRSETALSVLEGREYTDNLGIRNLWLDYAVADCRRYLLDQCAQYDLQLEEDELEQMKSILRTALETYSVSQLWSMIWMIVKDAASLSKRTYYNSRKAAATIPGKAKKILKRVLNGENILKQWTRREQHTEGTLGEIFGEYFGIDETTTGHEAFRIFNLIVPNSEEVSQLIAPSKDLMAKARADGIEAEVFICLASFVRQGLSVGDAIQEVLKQYSQLGLTNEVELNDQREDYGPH